MTTTGVRSIRIAERAATLEQGPIPPDLGHELNHPIHWTSMASITTIALGIVFLMVEKPDWLGSTVTPVIALVAGIILAQMPVHSSRMHVSMQDEKLAEEQPTGLSTKDK